VRTHPTTPYLWTDNGKDKVVLVDKNDYSVRSIQTIRGKRVIHTEFSGDGNLAYVSLYNKDGALTNQEDMHRFYLGKRYSWQNAGDVIIKHRKLLDHLLDGL